MSLSNRATIFLATRPDNGRYRLGYIYRCGAAGMGHPQRQARPQDCTDAFLDTFSFQARPFYEKLGYHIFGTLENHPAGHQHYFMTKKL
jgi:hypothetical protein